MIIRRFIKHKDVGVPVGIEFKDWVRDIIDETYLVLDYEKTLIDTDPEAIEMLSKIKNGKPFHTNATNIKCKECGSFMDKYPLIQHPKANRLRWKFRYICHNEACLYEYLTKEDS